MLKARLLLRPKKSHKSYLRGRKQFPLKPPVGDQITAADAMFTTLKAFRDPPPKVARRPRSWWLSDATTRMLDQKAHMVRNPLATTAQIKKKGREIKQSLKKDVIRRCTVAAEAIAAYLTGPPQDWNLRGAHGVLGRWHKHAAKHPPKPSREDLITVTNDRIQLYQQELPSPPGDPIPVLVQPDPINDSVPTPEEISAAVRGLRSGSAPGASGIRPDDLKQWCHAAHPTDGTEPQTAPWDALVKLIQHIWDTGELPKELLWIVLVLIPKPNTTVRRGIGLLETVWKVLEGIIDTRVKEKVEFHDCLHGFKQHRGTGTATIELKLWQELAALEQVPLHGVFIDLTKAYDTTDRPRALESFKEYGMGPKMLRLLQAHWAGQLMIAKEQGFYGPPFGTSRVLNKHP